MNIPLDQIKSLEARGFKVNNESVVIHGKSKLTVAFDGWTFSKDLSTATPTFKVVSVERPDPIPRKPKTVATNSAKAGGAKK